MEHCKDGQLLLWDIPALELAESTVSADKVFQLTIGPHCFRGLLLNDLLSRLARYSNVQALSIYDDYVRDEDLDRTRKAFLKVFRNAVFLWKGGYEVEGKNGR